MKTHIGAFFIVPSAVSAAAPSILLDSGTFFGSSSGIVDSFLGIPFAQPPIGDLRFRAPQPNDPYTGFLNATSFGLACIQQPFKAPPDAEDISPAAREILQEIFPGTPANDSEDCLYNNVIKPSNAAKGSGLPVVYWMYGGGFEIGSSANPKFNGTAIVERSLQLELPVIYVSVNYRLAALGFPTGKETREARNGNIGLQDQRLGLRWVRRYITAFGGDPSKVTIWGESAGAMSASTHMLINDGDTEGLFRAVFAQSGAPFPTGYVEDNQHIMDTFATAAGCGAKLGSAAVFDCLRSVSLDAIRAGIKAAPNQFSYTSFASGWFPESDGEIIPAPLQQMVLHSNIANVPLVSGSCDDEGTLLSLSNSNITTAEGLEEYITKFWASGNRTATAALLEAYPEDPSIGSPFDTGNASAITSQFKRLAAMTSDIVFQAPRRLFLERLANRQPVFAFLNKRLKSTPVLGAYHTSDLQNVFGPGDMTDYLIRFAATLNPNGGGKTDTDIEWPQYTLDSREMLTFLDGDIPLSISEDTYRKEAMQVMTDFSLANTLP